jgi:hypothetical protein
MRASFEVWNGTVFAKFFPDVGPQEGPQERVIFGDTDGIIIALLGGTKPMVINPHGPGGDPEAFRLLKAFTVPA